MDAIRMRGIDQRLGLLGSGQWAIGSGRMGDGRMGEWACGVWRCGDSWRQAIIYPTRARSSTYRTAHCPRSTAHCPLPTAHCLLPTAHRPIAHSPILLLLFENIIPEFLIHHICFVSNVREKRWRA